MRRTHSYQKTWLLERLPDFAVWQLQQFRATNTSSQAGHRSSHEKVSQGKRTSLGSQNTELWEGSPNKPQKGISLDLEHLLPHPTIWKAGLEALLVTLAM